MRFLWLLLLLAFTALIFASSSLPAGESAQLSRPVASLLTEMGELFNITVSQGIEHQLRKLAHFTEFAILAWLYCRTFAAFSVGKWTAAGYIFFFCLLTAVSDEYIQIFSPGRSSAMNDILLDFAGSFCMWLAYRIWNWHK